MKDMSIALALLINACGLFVIAAALGARPGPECTARQYEREHVEDTRMNSGGSEPLKMEGMDQ